MNNGDERLIRSIVKAIDRLQASIHKHAEAICEQNESASTPNEPQPPPTIRTELNLPPAVTEYCASEQRERPSNQKWERAKTILECAGVLVAIVLVGLTYKTLGQVKAQVGVMRQQLEVADRPWLGVDFLVRIERVTVSKQGIGADLITPVKNYGTRPAIDVGVDVLVVAENIAPNGEKRFWNNSDIACSAAEGPPKRDGRNRGGVIFPGITSPHPMNIGVGGDGAFDPESALEIIGCIVYRFTPGKTHHTRFCFISEKPAADFKPGDKLFSCEFGNTAD